jgi:hypothetical protein
MKRTGFVLLLAALGATGCIALPPQWMAGKETLPVAEAPPPPPPPPVVQPDQVNEKNAAECLNALRDELDYAANEPLVNVAETPPAVPVKPGSRSRP